jgi:hypothetical protein
MSSGASGMRKSKFLKMVKMAITALRRTYE